MQETFCFLFVSVFPPASSSVVGAGGLAVRARYRRFFHSTSIAFVPNCTAAITLDKSFFFLFCTSSRAGARASSLGSICFALLATDWSSLPHRTWRCPAALGKWALSSAEQLSCKKQLPHLTSIYESIDHKERECPALAAINCICSLIMYVYNDSDFPRFMLK